jgi:hypothetical protein
MCEMMPVPTDAFHHGLDRIAATAIADELVGLSSALSDLAYELGGDAATVRKHMSSLQAIDLITQVHLALADVLRSDASIADRLSQVPVEALGQRLRDRIFKVHASSPPPEISSSEREVIFF